MAKAKTYRGEPGPPMKITVRTGSAREKNLSKDPATGGVDLAISWGDISAASGNVAFMILCDLLKDAVKAKKLANLFKHRTIAVLTKGQPWTLDEEAIRDTVKDIEKTASSMAQSVRMGQQQPAPVAVDSLPRDVGWSEGKKPIHVANPPPEKDRQ